MHKYSFENETNHTQLCFIHNQAAGIILRVIDDLERLGSAFQQ
ncbi:MAG: hypothetical protein ACI93R_000411 [Flavobacteriales bacterium]|jgi:hypothetical protein